MDHNLSIGEAETGGSPGLAHHPASLTWHTRVFASLEHTHTNTHHTACAQRASSKREGVWFFWLLGRMTLLWVASRLMKIWGPHILDESASQWFCSENDVITLQPPDFLPWWWSAIPAAWVFALPQCQQAWLLGWFWPLHSLELFCLKLCEHFVLPHPFKASGKHVRLFAKPPAISSVWDSTTPPLTSCFWHLTVGFLHSVRSRAESGWRSCPLRSLQGAQA